MPIFIIVIIIINIIINIIMCSDRLGDVNSLLCGTAQLTQTVTTK